MATVKQYVTQLYDLQQSASRQMGVDLRQVPLQFRVLLLCVDLAIGMLLHVLTTNSVITDAQLTAEVSAVKGAAYQMQSVPQLPDDGTEPPFTI